MSDGDVSLIRDEDVLRRMWQQTEDFSRKKEIRAHMYRLREERLRNLYSPEPTADGKDLKDLSNAGWNVESENRTTDDGHTHVKSVRADIQGRYDVDGGKGQFSAADHHKQAVTEYDDGNTSLKRNEDYSKTAAHEQVVRQTDDGTHFSSTTSSSTSTSKFEQVSSKHENVPYITDDNYDLASQKYYDTNRNEEMTSNRITKTNNYEQNLRNDYEQGELVSRKIDYPDDNTKVIVETRCLPDGTRVTSTRREFRAPSVQTSRSEHYSQQVRNESKSSSYTSSHKRSHTNESTSKIIRDSIEDNVHDIVDSQRVKDDFDFRKEHINKYNDDTQKTYKSNNNEKDQREYTTSHENQNIRRQDIKETRYYKNTDDRNPSLERNVDEINKNNERIINERNVHQVRTSYDDQNIRQHNVKETRSYNDNEEHILHFTKDRDVPDRVKPNEPLSNERHHSSYDDKNVHNQDTIKKTRLYKDSEEKIHNVTKEKDIKENVEKKTTDHYQTTYQTDYVQRKISNEWSPTHQAWASTLRSDSPSRPTTRASSPGNKTFKSSNSSLRSSVSPDKNYRKTPSRGGSPNKIDRFSPSRTVSDKYSSTQSSSYSIHETKTNKYSSLDKQAPKSNSPTRYSPERKPHEGTRKRPSVSPEKQAYAPSSRPRDSPQRESPARSSPSPDRKFKNYPKDSTSPMRQTPETNEFYSIHENTDTNKSSQHKVTEIRNNTTKTTTRTDECIDTSTITNKSPTKPSESPERQPGYMKHTASSTPKTDRAPSPTKPYDSSRKSPTKHVYSASPEPSYTDTKLHKVKDEHQQFINEERKSYTKYDEDITTTITSQRKSPQKERPTQAPQPHQNSPNRMSLSPDRNTSPSRKSLNTDETSPLTTDTPKNIDNQTSVIDRKSPEKAHIIDKETPQRKSPQKEQLLQETQPRKVSPTRMSVSPDRNPSPSRRLPNTREESPLTENRKAIDRKSPEKDSTTDKDIKTKPKDESTKSYRQPSREASPVKRDMSPDKHYRLPSEKPSVPSTKDLSPKRKSSSPVKEVTNNLLPSRKSPTKENLKGTESTTTETTSISTSSKITENIEDIKTGITRKEQDTCVTNKILNVDTNTTKSPSRSSPRRSVSPTKPVTKDEIKYKQTTEFITMEKTNEETHKRAANDRPRKLVTPSTSPTRKPKPDETAPSTGQSTPTTTASGFVYFSSPQAETPQVTDLDDKEPIHTNAPNKHPIDDLQQKEPLRRSPSPTKIPCRSPSPEKVATKENLPRKSSLKKPSIDNTPSEKPPTSFLISPTDDDRDVKKEKPNKKDTPIKAKPPLERRETYEERCRKILGMTDEDTTIDTKNETFFQKKSTDTSPSISPCESPIQFDDKHFSKDSYEVVDIVDISEEKVKSSTQKSTRKPNDTLPSSVVNVKEITENRTFKEKNIETFSDISDTQKPSLDKDSTLKRQPENKSKDISTAPKAEFRDKDTRSPSKSPQRKPSRTSPERNSLIDSRKFPEKINAHLPSKTDQDNNNVTIEIIDDQKSKVIRDESLLKEDVHKSTETRKKTEISSDFILSEREQQILDRVQSSLRKLSPDRKQTQPGREKSPEKPITKTEAIDVVTISKETIEECLDSGDKSTKTISEEKSTLKKSVTNDKPVTKTQIPSKPSSRNVSPNKKSPNSPNLSKGIPETGKIRSSSPKKPMSPIEKKPGSPIERPQSPQVPKTIGKKEPTSPHNQKTSTTSTSKNEKTNVTDIKKTTILKQHTTSKISQPKVNVTKVSPNSKPTEMEPKRTYPLKGRNVDTKVTRTTSDIAMKSPVQKKVSPQRMKSKPEIQVTNASSNRITKQTNIKQQKSSVKESTTKLPVSKPKSAIDLNTSTDDDDIIIDVQQAKSSRENSPDRICPTPVGFSEDVGTPRFPDEVNEPDDEFSKRTHHIIHETESIVDDIVEICEDDELFVKRTETEWENRKDDSLLSVNDKVSKFTKKIGAVKPKDSTTHFKETEIRKHSDFNDENLKSDECLLSVSEKVNKFAKGPVGQKDKSPSRNIVEEYDKDTIYQDDYTKLSVNDKAHLFIETAENIKTTKPKSTVQKPERPDLSDVDESLKSDECLLSVSDKVNKFVKTAEQVLSDVYIIEEKDKKIKEQHDKIMKQIVENVDDIIKSDVKKPSMTKEEEIITNYEETNKDVPTVENPVAPKTKSPGKVIEKSPSVKITTLRSSEAVKKAKALFENIATTTNKTKETVHTKTTKLTDIGVAKKITKSTPETTQPGRPNSNIKHVPLKDKQPTIEHTDYDREINEEQDITRPRERSPETKHKAPIPRDASPTSATKSTLGREKSPVTRTMSPITREKSPVHRTLTPTPRDKSPASGRRSPMTRTKSPLAREESPIGRTKSKSPVPQAPATSKKVLSRFPPAESNSPKQPHSEEKTEKPSDKVPGYQRPTKTSQLKEEKSVEEIEVSSRRGSGKFGVELRRTSADRSSVSSERRRSSDHHQPCIEDIFDLDLLEQMLEKVVGYEQRRRIRAQIRVAKKRMETEHTTTVNRITKHTTTKVGKTKSPERPPSRRSPDRQSKSHLPHSPERQPKTTPNKTKSPERQTKDTTQVVSQYELVEHNENFSQLTNGHPKEPHRTEKDMPVRPRSPEKPKSTPSKVTRPTSPEKKSRPISPSKPATPKTKSSRISEYASAYLKKVGLNENEKPKHAIVKTKKAPIVDEAKTKRVETSRVVESHHSSKTTTARTSSKDVIEIVQINGKKSPSPERIVREQSQDRYDGVDHPRKQSPERKLHEKVNIERQPSPQRKSPSPMRQSPERTMQRSPSPDAKSKIIKKETIIKTVYDVEKKIPQKQAQEEKPSWVTNRNLKKVTSETRTFSSKKIEPEKPKYRPSSPSKAITKPIDVITSSYGPGPLDADGRPLFGIKALRNGASNYQVKGTVIRQEFHSKNGGEPEGTVSVTAYSTEPEDLEKLLKSQGEKPSRLHGLAAITTTKKFGGDTGTTFSEVSTKEERAALDQFTHSDRRIQESRIDRHSDAFEVRDHAYSQKAERIHGDGEKYIKKTIEEPKKKTADSGRSKESDKRSEKTMQKTERRVDDRKTVRQSSVKSLTEKFIKNASETTKTERTTYPKAGLILRTTSMKDSVSSDSSAHAGLARTDSEHSLASLEDVVTTREQIGDVIRTTTTTTTTKGRMQERSFLDSSTKVTGVQDILTRMKNADIVIEEGDTNEDSEARALLNKFLGATVLMAGMQNYVTEKPGGVVVRQETVHTQNSGSKLSSSRQVDEIDIEQCWDERVLRKLLDECTDYEVRRRLRARIRALMAEQEACASAVTEALAAAGETVESVDTEDQQQSGERGESLLLPLLQGLLQGGGEKLLAGLGTASHDVVADVRRSLQRLRLALAPPADHPQARALLALADRLEDALDAADRLDGCKRKTRRRSRTARHTVGVTREELEEARRMVDRDTLLPEPVKTPTSSAPSSAPSIESNTPERKQSVDDQVSYHDAIESRKKPLPITHSVSYEPTPKVNRDAQVVERRAPTQRRPDFFRHSIADSAATDPPKIATERWKTESKGGIAAIANKFDVKIEKEVQAPIKRAPIHRPQFNVQQKPVEEPRRSVYRPLPPTYNFAAPPIDDSKPLHRSNSNSKRLRMKRANTIDIGRPYGGYRYDDDADEQSNTKAPIVPEFKPQTENDKKFLAFMQKNEENGRHPVGGPANWSSRFGNIKNTFENREREENTRSSSTSASSAKRFWQAADSSQTSMSRPRKFLNESTPEIIKPPWVSQRRESLRSSILPTTKQIQQQTIQPPVPLSPTKPAIVKPFVARPIPVNQFSHAPMSAFKPPQKILSPTSAPANIWSPPSTMPVSPSVENPGKPMYQSVPYIPTYPDNSKRVDNEKPKQLSGVTPKYENKLNQSTTPKTYEYRAPTPPTHAQNSHNYPIQTIPSQNNLAAPQLVKKIDTTNCYRNPEVYPTKIDAQQLQIEFYEKQIREKKRRDTSSERREIPVHKPPAPPTQAPYTIVDYTPPHSASSFIPLQQTPDIEKAKAHKVDYLPDVVINENNPPNYLTSPTTRITPVSPIKTKSNPVYQNGDVRLNGDDGAATEHDSVVTKVMRGPVRGSATITAGVRTRGAADSLRGVLDKLSSPKHDVISQIEKKKRENARNQVRLAPPPAPGLSPSHAISPTRTHIYDDGNRLSGSRSPALAASRESIFSSESPASRGSSPGSALTRSGSWHRIEAPKAASPRKVVARTKSMHLLAVPKLFEGGIAQEEVLEKKKTVEAYFSGQTSPNRLQQVRARPARAQVQFALGRSKTMPTVSELQFLDESNADDAFEDLVSALA
ncbi:titin isoform X2 [Zerene cesonia]|uniref:titin isoform X2 n=1 Tax=Zerene cesonia TaxID=33412 RepID=UPI0018E51EE6|nr:titin isoform X2 [Zerene cesonia]